MLGDAGTRPKAPFAYTNTWGSVIAMSLVFVGAWLARARGRSRVRWSVVTLVAVAAAMVPVLYSLNRGLWGSLALGGVGLAVLAATKGRPALLMACGVLAGIGLLTVLVTPLGSLVTDRLENQHSNDRRGGLLTLTTTSVTDGLAGPGLRRHPRRPGQLRLDHRGLDPGVPRLRGAAAGHPGAAVDGALLPGLAGAPVLHDLRPAGAWPEPRGAAP